MPVALVTGASSGIGAEIARGLARDGWTVVPCGRNPERTHAIADELGAEPLLADLSTLDAVRGLASAFLDRHERLDVLVNNAGVWHPTRKVSADGYEETFAINHLAPFLLTHLVMPALRAADAPRVVTVASKGHRVGQLDLDDLHFEQRVYEGFRAYATSKLCNVLFAAELARRAPDVLSNSVHPGDVVSNVTRDMGPLAWLHRNLGWLVLISAEKGARGPLKLATDPELAGVTGRYFHREKPKRPSRTAQDAELARRLWERSVELTDAPPLD